MKPLVSDTPIRLSAQGASVSVSQPALLDRMLRWAVLGCVMSLAGCGAADIPAPITPVAVHIAASPAAQSAERFLAELPPADVTTSEGQEYFSFSTKRVLFIATIFAAQFSRSRADSGSTAGALDGIQAPCLHLEESVEGEVTETRGRAENCTVERDGKTLWFDGSFVAWTSGEAESLRIRVETDGWSTRRETECDGETRENQFTFYGTLEATRAQVELDWLMEGEGWQRSEEGCRALGSLAFRYTGSVDESGTSGRGTVGVENTGRAEIETSIPPEPEGYRCDREAHAGWTRITSGPHIAEVRYDGASECQSPPSAPVFVDGQAAGTTKYACSAGGDPSGMWPLALLLLFACRRR